MEEVSLTETFGSSMAIQQVCHKSGLSYAVFMSFGQRLKERREDVRLTGSELGNRLDPPVSKQTIAHWEANRYKPQVDQITQLCEILNISADALVRGMARALSPKAIALANAYDSMAEEDRAHWDLILMAMPSQLENVDRETGKPLNSSDLTSRTMIPNATTVKQLGPGLRDALIVGKGARHAADKPPKVPKQRSGSSS